MRTTMNLPQKYSSVFNHHKSLIMENNEFAVMNLETLKYSIEAYASYAEGVDKYDLKRAIEQAQFRVQKIIDLIRFIKPVPYKGYEIEIGEYPFNPDRLQVCIRKDGRLIFAGVDLEGTYDGIFEAAKNYVDSRR